MRRDEIKKQVKEYSIDEHRDKMMDMYEYPLSKCKFIINKGEISEEIITNINGVTLFKRFMIISSLDPNIDSKTIDYMDILTFNTVAID